VLRLALADGWQAVAAMSLSQGELLDKGLHQLLTTVLADLQVRAHEA